MKILNRINILISSLLVLVAGILVIGFTVYAVEPAEENPYNSVVEIESYSIDGGYIEAGKESNISLTVHNANKSAAANNLIVVVKSNSGMIFPKYGDDNQFYVGNLKAGNSTTVSIPIVVASSFAGDYVDFTCDLIYVSGGQRITNTSTMILPGQSYEAIAVNSLEVSAHAVKNNQSLLSIGYNNNGTDNIIDAVLVVDGNVSESTREIDLGAIAAGKAYNKDFNIIFTESGDQTVSVMLKYTDANGEQVQSDLGAFRVTVSEENASTIIEKAPNPYLLWIGRGISVVALLLAAVVTFLFVKKH
jgi:hypothetical protein